jgi:pantoate kinase
MLLKGYSDLTHVGATGGGYILSKGVKTRATRFNGSTSRAVRIVVNGDPYYQAKTTGLALQMLVDAAKPRFGTLLVEQTVDVPIGYGFGASAASALSAVYAASAALGIDLPRRKVAYFAHAADILSQTGLGTVSVIYGSAGAGAIIRAGGPGIARFLKIPVPKRLKIVTASIAPYPKSVALSSQKLRARINQYGDEALMSIQNHPDLETLAEAGRVFTNRVGLKTREVGRLMETAMSNGAISASQNMIGYAIHALVMEPDLETLVGALTSLESMPRVDVFEVNSSRAGLVTPEAKGGKNLYQTVTKSFV